MTMYYFAEISRLYSFSQAEQLKANSLSEAKREAIRKKCFFDTVLVIGRATTSEGFILWEDVIAYCIKGKWINREIEFSDEYSKFIHQAERDHKYPKSKWTKAMIMYELSLQMETNSIKYVSLSKKPLAFLKYLCLETNEWHHTSSYYLTTDYYEVRGMSDWSTEDIEESYQNWCEYMAEKKAEKKAEE